jgi:hypothetical protein
LAGEKELTVTLRYEVDASTRGCWDESRFRRGVANRIGYDPFREEAPLELQIHVGGSASAVDGQVVWRDASGVSVGERTFVAKDGNCGKLMTEMSFAVGLQIEFLRLKPPKPTTASVDVPAPPPTTTPPSLPAPETPSPAAPPVPEASPPVEDTPPSPPKPATETAVEADNTERPLPETTSERTASLPVPRWSLWAGAGPSLAWRLSPGVTADGRLFVGARRGSLSFEMGAEATYPSGFHRWDGSGFRHTLIGATFAICGHIEWFSACALGRASQVRITGQGVDQPRSPNGFVGQVGARVAVTVHVAGPWSLATHLDGLGLLTPSRVQLNQAPVWEMPRTGVVAGIDVLARFR